MKKIVNPIEKLNEQYAQLVALRDSLEESQKIVDSRNSYYYDKEVTKTYWGDNSENNPESCFWTAEFAVNDAIRQLQKIFDNMGIEPVKGWENEKE